ncbi:transcriptional regulator [Paraburkholderia youngii]|uniref:Helix-turn-helix domain-containing protein n=1 Tax=Paraburkholderia youngii TaxID=2782701 RepID=A0ABX2NPM8_9BURK|nr:Cro/CI family transcriptional regulator [Paraburkholderia youngii]NVI06379.1 helix-turn-helix domain-containing protein [Paraburkholderia youngii]
MSKHPIAIAAATVGGYKALADILGVTKGAVHQWMSPGRQVPIEHCTPIEQATAGIVTRQMLRPDDWQSIWPELVGKSGVSATERAAASDDVQPPVGGTNKSSKSARMVI